MNAPESGGVESSGETRLERALHLACVLALACFAFTVHTKSVTALGNIGAYLPLLAAPWLAWRSPVRRAALRDPLFLLALAFVALLALSAAWSPAPLASLNQVRKEAIVIAVVALTMGAIGCDAWALRVWCLAIVAGAVWRAAQQLIAWGFAWATWGPFLPDYGVLRDYGYGIVLALPFVFVARESVEPRLRLAATALALLLAVLAVVTGSRGTWFALALMLAGSAWLLGAARVVLATGAVALTTGLALAVLVPGNPITGNINRGLDSSFRSTGTWGPAVTMAVERPWTGYGYGRFVFDAEYNRRKVIHPEWVLPSNLGPRSIGAHSNYLQIAFAAGAIGLALLLALVAAMIRRAWILGTSGPPWKTMVARAVLLAFAGQYLVYGFIETMSWEPLALLLGLLLALSHPATLRARVAAS